SCCGSWRPPWGGWAPRGQIEKPRRNSTMGTRPRRVGWPGSGVVGLAVLLAGCAPAPPAAPAAPASGAASGSPPSAVAATSGPSAAAPSTGAAAPRPPTHLKVATQRLASDVALYVASARGYFAEQGLEVEFEDIVTGMGALPPLAAGQLDVG